MTHICAAGLVTRDNFSAVMLCSHAGFCPNRNVFLALSLKSTRHSPLHNMCSLTCYDEYTLTSFYPVPGVVDFSCLCYWILMRNS